MSIWQAVALSVIEGVTEFLPISSTAHLMLASKALGLPQTEFVKSFEIAIQSGAILSVAALYARKIIKNPDLIWKIGIAFLPTVVVGAGFYRFIKGFLIGNDWVSVAMLLAGGLALVKLPIFGRESDNKLLIGDLSVNKLLAIGFWQSAAVVPGVSRALATIWGGMAMGLSQKEAVEMSFLLAVPTMIAATGFDLLKTGMNFSAYEWGLLGAGLAGAFISALMVVRWLLEFVQKHDFKLFGWYRVILAMIWGMIILFQ